MFKSINLYSNKLQGEVGPGWEQEIAMFCPPRIPTLSPSFFALAVGEANISKLMVILLDISFNGGMALEQEEVTLGDRCPPNDGQIRPLT